MSCPVHRTNTPVIRFNFARRIASFLGRRPITEALLILCLLVVGATWYSTSDVQHEGLRTLLASTATGIILLLGFITRTRHRRRFHAANAALLTGEIQRGSELYRAVVDTAADAIILADQRGTVLSFNRAAEQIFGYSEAEVMGRNVQVLMPQDQWQAHQGYMERYLDTKVPHVVGIGRVVEGQRKDGTFFPLQLSIAEWSNGPDEVGFTAILRDITTQQQVQQALIESEAQGQMIMDCATDYAIYQLDLNDRIVKWNKGTERILGYSAEELKGFDINRLFPGDGSEQAAADKEKNASIDLERHETEGWRVRGDGTRFWASGVVQPILDSDAHVIGMAVVLRDMTKQRADAEMLQAAKENAEAAAELESKLRAEIEESNLELTAANQGLQQFTSIVAHDLRAPLKRIDAFISALRDDYADRLDEEGREIMTRVGRGAARMELMLDSLLDYSRYNAKAIGGKSAELSHVIKGVMETFDNQKSIANIAINTEGVPRVKGDPLLLAHVFQNLISNSIKFRRGGKANIAVDVTATDDSVFISVTDDGIGIEPQFADQVFDMFYRLHDEDEYDGTGIGLTVCRKIINDHGGRIWVDKDYTGGTRINMTLLPISNEGQTAPDLVMMLYQSMQRRTRTANPGIDADAVPAHLQSRRAERSSHHAQFDRRRK
jgi:PAS domain S-box-containing protein